MLHAHKILILLKMFPKADLSTGAFGRIFTYVTRSGLVERALSLAGAGTGGETSDLVKLVPCLPSLAILQVDK